jgi:hypothetical protein
MESGSAPINPWRARASPDRKKAASVRPEGGDLILYSKLLSFQIVDTHVVASRVFHLCGDRRINALVALTQLANACFQAHQRLLLLFRGGSSLVLKGISAFRLPNPDRERTGRVRYGLREKLEADAAR